LQHLLLFVVISVVIIILYFLTPVIIITPHYNYSATTYHDLACYMMPSYGDLTEKKLSRHIISDYLQTDSLWNMNYAVLLALPC